MTAVDPQWGLLIIAAGGVGIGASRGYMHFNREREKRRDEEAEFRHTIMGWPRIVSEDGVTITNARDGLAQKFDAHVVEDAANFADLRARIGSRSAPPKR